VNSRKFFVFNTQQQSESHPLRHHKALKINGLVDPRFRLYLTPRFRPFFRASKPSKIGLFSARRFLFHPRGEHVHARNPRRRTVPLVVILDCGKGLDDLSLNRLNEIILGKRWSPLIRRCVSRDC
jgi:hypothetical protein